MPFKSLSDLWPSVTLYTMLHWSPHCLDPSLFSLHCPILDLLWLFWRQLLCLHPLPPASLTPRTVPLLDVPIPPLFPAPLDIFWVWEKWAPKGKNLDTWFSLKPFRLSALATTSLSFLLLWLLAANRSNLSLSAWHSGPPVSVHKLSLQQPYPLPP